MKTYWIGRSTQCHIQLEHDSISRLHAELTVARDGRYYLIDCASSHGTFIFDNQRWIAVTQRYVEAEKKLKLGEIETSVHALLKIIQTKPATLQRNPETGEIIS